MTTTSPAVPSTGRQNRRPFTMPGPAPAHVKRFPPPPDSKYPHLYEVWPSLGWGEEEWFTLLTVRDDIFDAILRGIGSVNLSTDGAQKIMRGVRAQARAEEDRQARARQEFIDVRTREDKLRDERIRKNREQARASHRAPRRERPVEKRVTHSPRVEDTLREIAWGYDRSGVAEARGRSEGTVKAQYSSLMRFYGVGRASALVSYAFRDLPPDLLPGDLRPYLLKTRQHEMLVKLGRGLSMPEIGRSMYLSTDTVKTHSRRLYEALDVSQATEAVSFGFRAGMLFWKDGRVVGWRCGTVVDP